MSAGVHTTERPLRGSVDDLEWSDDGLLRVTFNLPPGNERAPL